MDLYINVFFIVTNRKTNFQILRVKYFNLLKDFCFVDTLLFEIFDFGVFSHLQQNSFDISHWKYMLSFSSMLQLKGNVTKAISASEMSTAAENLPLSCHDVKKEKPPRRCHDATAYKKILPRLYWTINTGTRPSDSFSLRVFYL